MINYLPFIANLTFAECITLFFSSLNMTSYVPFELHLARDPFVIVIS
jgi:hypothetical protein